MVEGGACIIPDLLVYGILQIIFDIYLRLESVLQNVGQIDYEMRSGNHVKFINVCLRDFLCDM